MDLTSLTIAEAGKQLSAKEITSKELVKAHLDRIAAYDKDVNAFLHVSETALDAADAIDIRVEAG